MSKSHEIDCWKCGEQSTLKTRSEFDGCCWACGAEIDLEDYLARAMDERDQLRAEVEALRTDAEKFRHVERAMEALGCDEREGGIVTAASLVLISSAHKLNAARGVIEQEGVTFDDDSIGDWRVTIERIDAAMAAKDGQP